MKTLKTYFKPISYLLTFLILLQGCTIYKSSGVSLDEAFQAETKVKVEKKNGEKEKYLQIVVMDDGKYYGKKKVSGKTAHNHTLIFIDEDDINKIQIKDKTASTIVTIAIPVVIIGAIIGIVAHSLDNMDVLGSY